MGGPEIDAREKSINDLQTKRIQTRRLQRAELGYVESDKVLILPVSVLCRTSHAAVIWAEVKVVRMLSCASMC